MNSYDLTGIEYHQTIQDVHCLKELVSALPANPIIVNIGACYGTSAMAMLEERLDAFIFSIDVKPSPKEVEHLQLAGLYHYGRVVRLLGRSQDIGKHWPGQVDMVYVDGSHIYDEVVEDIEVWLPIIKPKGIICFHDYDKPICPGVKPAVDRYFDVNEAIMFVDSMVAFRV
jgi:predicted O-methyltransferase YrrM